MTTFVGQTLDRLNLYGGYPQKNRDSSDNWSLTYKYWTTKAGAVGLLPATGSTPPEPEGSESEFSSLELNQVNISAKSPNLVDVELIYTKPNSGSNVPLLPGEVRRYSETSLQDAPVSDKVKAASESDKNEVINNQKKKTYPAPVPIYGRVENTSSSAWTAAYVIGDVGKRKDPTGLTVGAESDDINGNPRWLQSRRSITEEGDRHVITEEWSYATEAWVNNALFENAEWGG